ncbi:MAG: tRNA pseudouridine(38-40) synthase TruA [Elusimicrobia bacterium]|nr:tRNA pseudouridine(38-40) synthase TruA [Elusimicrobiota bacterium]
MHIKAVVEYDGTGYYGWQVQPGRKTVQAEVERALGKVFGGEIRVKYSSRTDRGVHARGQVIAFRAPDIMPVSRIESALNDRLKGDIIVKNVGKCPEEFNPRYDVKSKLYVYSILNSKYGRYDLVNYAWHVPGVLDWRLIRKAAGMLRGRHDFSLFSAGSGKKETKIDIISASVKKEKDIYRISFRARYFLTYMIRYLAGYLVKIGKGRENAESLAMMLRGRGRMCDTCAPACGLELRKIWFQDTGGAF